MMLRVVSFDSIDDHVERLISFNSIDDHVAMDGKF